MSSELDEATEARVGDYNGVWWILSLNCHFRWPVPKLSYLSPPIQLPPQPGCPEVKLFPLKTLASWPCSEVAQLRQLWQAWSHVVPLPASKPTLPTALPAAPLAMPGAAACELQRELFWASSSALCSVSSTLLFTFLTCFRATTFTDRSYS